MGGDDISSVSHHSTFYLRYYLIKLNIFSFNSYSMIFFREFTSREDARGCFLSCKTFINFSSLSAFS